MSLECTFEEFKQRYKEFDKEVNTMDVEELENSFKCISLSYLSMTEDMWRSSALIVLGWATDKYIDRMMELKEF